MASLLASWREWAAERLAARALMDRCARRMLNPSTLSRTPTLTLTLTLTLILTLTLTLTLTLALTRRTSARSPSAATRCARSRWC